ncbi:hypothetical protein C2845_PM10G16670 [Panicum miliaceum]|uniref:Uncharacterized protein n=1 Tax=Panicum miliaceum TaxID=4540 RepID=A0A3L6PA18_PANMI|nr:hypothetical protein C2845_PM10G16670 [Panicum miliaceum]
MRPERGGRGGGRPSPWRTPTPYLFLGLAVMMVVVAVALLVLLCSRRKPALSSRQEDVVDSEKTSSVRVLVPLDREAPRAVVVVMAGDVLPAFLASAKLLAHGPLARWVTELRRGADFVDSFCFVLFSIGIGMYYFGDL